MCETWTCTCCRRGLRDNRKENMSHAVLPYPHDTGFGLCRQCGDDTSADMNTDESVRRRMGWQMTRFCEAHFDLARRHLKPENPAEIDRDTSLNLLAGEWNAL